MSYSAYRKKAWEFWQRFIAELNCLGGLNKSAEDFEFVQLMVKFSPLCKTKIAGLSCSRPIFNEIIAAAVYLCEELGYTDTECIDLLDAHRTENQGPITINILRRVQSEVTGREDITCSNCRRGNNVRDLPIKDVPHGLRVTYGLIHAKGAKVHQLATWLDKSRSTITERTKKLDRDIPHWRTQAKPKGRNLKDMDGKPATLPLPEEILQAPSDIEFAAEPTPTTKSAVKKHDLRRIEAQGKIHTEAATQKALDPAEHKKSVGEQEQRQKNLDKAKEEAGAEEKKD